MIQLDSLSRDLNLVREKSPLIHNITNYVVMNNTANALLAIGASPVMAHAREEVEEMASMASALVLNIGTLEPAWVEAMIMAGKKAKEKGIPVIFDPVGAGATSYRNEVCKQIIAECQPAIIRGNASEIIALYTTQNQTKGVDSTASSEEALESAKKLAEQFNTVIVISGAADYITDGKVVELVRNGHPLMPRVTGMGCTATAIVAAFAAVNPDYLQAATHAMAIMGVAGEIAAKQAKGPGTMQLFFLDELANLDEEAVKMTLK